MSEEINEEAQVGFIEGTQDQNPFADNDESVSPVTNEDDSDSLLSGEIADLDNPSDETETGFLEEEPTAFDSGTYADAPTSESEAGIRDIVFEAADQQYQEVDSEKLDDIVGDTKAANGKEPSFAGFNCTVGCAGNCAGSCSGTCHNSCYNGCKSTYSN